MRPSFRISVLFLLFLSVIATPAGVASAACNNLDVNLTFHPGEHGGIDSPFLFANADRTVRGTGLAASNLVSLAYLPAPGATVGSALVVLKENCTGWDDSVCPGRITPCAKTTLTTGQTPSGDATLTFEVPDVKTGGRSRGGHVRVAVTASEVPCWLADASASCPVSAPTGMGACIDRLTPLAGDPKSAIDTVTALPGANDFSRVCDSPTIPNPRPCKADAKGLDYAVDAHGDLLIPMDWSKVIRKHGTPSDDCPPPFQDCDARDLTAWTTLSKRVGQPGPIAIPATDNAAVQSFNLDGEVFSSPPKFEVAPAPAPGRFELLGDADKPLSVLRIRRCPNGGQACDASAAYFDVAARVKDGGAGTIPKSGCGDAYAKPCRNDGDCAPGVPCVAVGGTASGFHWKSAAAAAATVADRSPPAGGSGAPSGPPRMLLWVFTVVAIGVAWRIGHVRRA